MASRTITYTDPYGHGNLITKLLYPPTTTRRLVLEGNLDPPSLELSKLSDLVSALSITEPGSTNDERVIIFPSVIIVLASGAPKLFTMNPYDINPAKSLLATPVPRKVSFASQLVERKGNICTQCRRFDKPADECIFEDHEDGLIKCNPCRHAGCVEGQCRGLNPRKKEGSDNPKEEGDDDDAGEDILTSDDEGKPKKKKKVEHLLSHKAGRVAKKRAAKKA